MENLTVKITADTSRFTPKINKVKSQFSAVNAQAKIV